jgi:hypothetical protein
VLGHIAEGEFLGHFGGVYVLICGCGRELLGVVVFLLVGEYEVGFDGMGRL